MCQPLLSTRCSGRQTGTHNTTPPSSPVNIPPSWDLVSGHSSSHLLKSQHSTCPTGCLLLLQVSIGLIFFKRAPNYTNIESLRCTPEANITLCQLYLNKKIKREGPQNHRPQRRQKSKGWEYTKERKQQRGEHKLSREESERSRRQWAPLGREGRCPGPPSPQRQALGSSVSPASPSCLDTKLVILCKHLKPSPSQPKVCIPENVLTGLLY